MNKEELITKIAEDSGLTKADCNKALNAFIKSIMDAIKAKKEVRLLGFGTFYSLARNASNGFNPRTRVKLAFLHLIFLNLSRKTILLML